MSVDIDAIERVARAATPGPWQWYGNTKMHEVYLATVHSGRVFVMDFARWGMSDAQPRFQVREGHDPPYRGAISRYGIMKTLGELGAKESPLGPRFEVPYRRQFIGIGHPDAAYMAACSPDVVLALISRIRELEALQPPIALAPP